MVRSIQAITKRLIFIVRAWWNSQTAPKPKPTREEIQVFYETLDSEDFAKWYNKAFPRTLNGEAGIKQAMEHLVNHPRHWADMDACRRIMDRQRDKKAIHLGGSACPRRRAPRRDDDARNS